MIRFNALEDKSPHGAVTNHQLVTFNVWVHQDFYFKTLHFVCINDFTHEEIRQEFTFTGKVEDHYRQFQCQLSPFEVGLYFYDFEFHFEDSIGYLKNHQFSGVFTMEKHAYESWQLTVYDEAFTTPSWVKGGIMYQIFPDRFKKSPAYHATPAANEDVRVRHHDWQKLPYSPITHDNYHAEDFFMGNLAGIHEELDYFKSLNVNQIYLNPIMESPENHRYSTADYYAVDPYLGTTEDFQQLCQDFKKAGIRVILDGVFSHTGEDSLYFNRYGHYDSIGAYQSQESPYYDWFTFNQFPNVYQSWWGFTNLPTVVKENPHYQQFIFTPKTGVLNFWQRLGISGWRIDVADEFPDEFLDQLRTSAKNFDEDSFILGEVWEDATTKFSYNTRRRYFLGQQLDSVMNYPWREAIIQFVKHKKADEFALALHQLLENYPRPALHSLMNLLSSHDTERILTMLAFDNPEEVPVEERPGYRLSSKQYELAVQRFKVASFIQFTLPGIPSIYYGDEIGMYGFRDPYNRMTFTPEQKDTHLFSFFQRLTAFRQEFREDFTMDCQICYVADACIAYQRGQLLCIMNLDDQAHFIADHTGKLIFAEGNFYTTPHGIVSAPHSFAAFVVE